MNGPSFLLASLLAGSVFAQPLTQADLLKGMGENWPTYNGDYSGRRYSPLDQINASNVHSLSLAWTTRFAQQRLGSRRQDRPPALALSISAEHR